MESLLTPDFLQSVTPSQLEGLPSGQTGGSSLGKLIIGEKWYYTAVITAEQAQQLEKGDWLTLRFSKGAQQDIDAQVTYLSAAEDGKQAVVLTCREYLAQTSQLRHQAAQLVLRSYEGLRIPTNALRMSVTTSWGSTAWWTRWPASSRCPWSIGATDTVWCRPPARVRTFPSCGRGTRSSSPPVSSPADRSCSSSRPADAIGQ